MRRWRRAFCISAALAMMLALPVSCTEITPKEEQFFCMDTVFSFTFYGTEADACLQASKTLCTELDASFSESSETSLVTRIAECRAGHSCDLTPAEAELLQKITAFSEASDGKFDATIGSFKRLWNASAERNALPTKEERQAAAQVVGRDTYEVTDTTLMPKVAPLYFDFGASAKGYTADRLLKLMQAHQVSGFASLGGCIAVFGEKPDHAAFRFGIQCPEAGSNRCIGYLTARSPCVLSTSGDYQRNYTIGGKTFSQILDPETGLPVESPFLSVTVIGEDGLTTDVLSTWLMFLSPEEAIRTAKEYGCSAICVTRERRIFLSADLTECFELNPGCKGYEMGETMP